MNSNLPLMHAALAGSFGVRRYPLTPTMPAGLTSRTGLPVVSNRAFVADWQARRSRILAAARGVRTGN